MRLNRAIGFIGKLRTNFNTLKTAYHSPFKSHRQYGTPLWDQKNIKTIGTL